MKETKNKIRVPPGQKSELKKKKKKKSSSTEIVVAGTATLPAVSKKELKSYFGKHTSTILQMLEMNDTDGGLTLLKKKMLQTTVSLVPFAESMIRDTKSQRGIYQYTALVNQVRELIQDIKSDEDRKYLAQGLIESVIRPAFMEIAQRIITDHHEFRKTTERMLDPKFTQRFSEELQGLAKQLAKAMMEVYKEVESKTQDHLKS